MPVIDDPARDVQVSDRIAVEQELLLSVVVQQRGNRDKRQKEREARLIALLRIAILWSSTFCALHESTCLSVQMRQFAEGIEARVDLFARQRLQTLGAEALDSKRSHYAAVEHGVTQHTAINLTL